MNYSNNEVIRALRNEGIEVIEGRLGGREFFKSLLLLKQ